jgi:hypothetical protein
VVVRRHRNGTSCTSCMCGVPSVRESLSRPPRPLRLSLCGVPTVRNHGHDCLGPRDFHCAVTTQGERQCRNGMSRTSRVRGIPSVRESWSRSPRPPQLTLRSTPTVQSRGHDCLGPHDFHCAVTAQEELWRVTVPPGAPNIATSCADRGPSRICHAAPPPRNPNVQNSGGLHGKEC